MKTFCAIFLLLVLFFPSSSYALSEIEYATLLSTSALFKKYDSELNALWKRVRNKTPEHLKKDLLNDQRYYVRTGRDVDANNVFTENAGHVSQHNISIEEKYVLATKKRIQELQNYLVYLENNEIVIEGDVISLHDEAGGGFGVCTDISEKNAFISSCYHIGYYFELDHNKALFSYLETMADTDNHSLVRVQGKLDSPSRFNPDSVFIVQNDVQNSISNKRNAIPENVFSHIVENNDIQRLESLITSGYDINAPLLNSEDDFKVYPLTYAAEKNSIPVVRYLLQKGANCNVEEDSPISDSVRAVSIASSKYNVTMLKLLIQAGAQLSWPVEFMGNGMFDGCLCNIIANNDNGLLEYALNHGARPNAASCHGDACAYPLALAAKKNDLEAVRMLLKYGADVNYQDPYQTSALIVAIKNNNREMVQLFLQYGADVSKEGNDGSNLENKTPLEYAIENNKRSIVKMLR